MKVRLAQVGTVVYGAMSRRDWRNVTVQDVDFHERELRSQLLPLLHRGFLETAGDVRTWVAQIVEECREKIGLLLDFTDAEREFLNLLLDHGEIRSSLLTQDEGLAQRIKQHPLLQWKALNVRRYRGVR